VLFWLWLTLEANLHSGQVGDPLRFAPDAWYRVTDHLTLGVITSDLAVDRYDIQGGYDHVGIDGLWKLDDHFSAHARFLMREFDPAKPAVTLGAVAKWQHGAWAITTDPYLQLGLANQARGNRAAIFVPVAGSVTPVCGWAIDLRTGWNSDLAVIADGWYIPLYVGTRVRVARAIEVGAAVGFPGLLGPQNSASERMLFVTTRWQP
jgi:hypothetical protein